MGESEAKAKLKEILNITSSYAELAYGWDIEAEEDLGDFKQAILEVLLEGK